MSLQLRILPRAERDIDRTIVWILKHDPDAAARWLRAFEVAADRIASQPQSYSLAPEDEFIDREIRQFFFRTRRGRNYRALFTIVGEEIQVLRVRGPGQDILEPIDLN